MRIVIIGHAAQTFLEPVLPRPLLLRDLECARHGRVRQIRRLGRATDLIEQALPEHFAQKTMDQLGLGQ